MGSRTWTAAAVLSAALGASAVAAGPDLGEPASAAHLAATNLTVMPDGAGLPPGSGDAVTGADVFARHCQACHGADGRGGPNDALVGGIGSLTGDSPQQTVGSYWPYATTVFDYVRRAMPYQQPGTLSADDVYAVTAYLLHSNGIIASDTVLTAQSLPRVVMPNRDGFRRAYAAGVPEAQP